MISQDQLDELRWMLETCDDDWLCEHICIKVDGATGVVIRIDDVSDQHLPGLI